MLVGCVLARYMVVGLLDCSLPILYVSFIERYEASRTEASVVLSLLQGAQYAPGKSRVSRQEILSDLIDIIKRNFVEYFKLKFYRLGPFIVADLY